jgi:cytoskeleton protein RodZ
MSVIEVVSAEGETSQVEGPGRQLRRAREKLQLELSAVASQLHLTEFKLRALEEDDYEHLPDPVYVQGYLRNYANLLGISADPVLQAYRELVPAEENIPAAKPAGVRREVSSNHRVIRLATWGIVAVLVLLPLLWWRGYLQESEQRVVTGAESLLTEITEGGDGEQQGLPSGAAVTNAETPMVEAEPRSWAPQRDDEGSASQSSEASQPPITALEPAVPVETGSDRQPQPSRIVIELQGTSWVEVKDASGVTQISKLLHAGTKRQIQGTPPFKVVVGNTPVVTLTIDGKQFDLEPYSRRNVAKFTLDPDATDTP